MSRWRQLQDIEQGLPDMSAREIRAALEMFRHQMKGLSGPAVKVAQKRIHKLERAYALRLSKDDPTARD